MEDKGILIIGGSGYIGKEIIKKLIENKIKISCLSRKKWQETSFCKYFPGDVLNKNSLVSATIGKKIVIYLATTKGGSMKKCLKINVGGLKNTLEAMKENNVSKLIYLSTRNVNLQKRDNYSESKRLAEEVLKKYSIPSVILRPDFVFGVDKENYIYKLISISKKFKIFPVIGNGDKLFYPVNKSFVAKICIHFIEKFEPGTYDLYGDSTSFIKISRSLKKGGRFLFLSLPLRIFEICQPLFKYGLSIFQEDRPKPTKGFYYGGVGEDIAKLEELASE